MVSWGVKRQLAYLSLVTGVILIVIALPAFLLFYDPPSCSDGKQNQGEFGIDCGGECPLLCPAKAATPLIHWQRVFEAAPGVWNAAAYIENPNLDSGAYRAPYTFKLYDERNILVAERSGRTFIPPRRVFTVFEGTILTGERVPVRALFEFTDEPVWQKDIPGTPELRVINRTYTLVDDLPRVEAELLNPTLNAISNVEVSAILYDAQDNALGVSRTIIESIAKDETKSLTFTWPKPFVAPVSRIEIIYRVLPQ